MDQDNRASAPDFTAACLWMGLVNLLWILGVIWAVFGLWAVMLTGWCLNRLITWLERVRMERA